MLKADHFAFPVSDLDKAIAFYVEKLGLRLLSRDLDEEHHEAFAFLELEGGNLELLQSLDESNAALPFQKPEAAAPYTPHLALGTENLAGLVEDLGRKGVPILKGPMEIPGLVTWLYLADPDNNIIEFVQWL